MVSFRVEIDFLQPGCSYQQTLNFDWEIIQKIYINDASASLNLTLTSIYDTSTRMKNTPWSTSNEINYFISDALHKNVHKFSYFIMHKMLLYPYVINECVF